MKLNILTRRRFRPAWILAAVAVLSTGRPADAHFIWIHLLEQDHTARAEILFGDGIYQDSDANLVRYVEGLNAWAHGGKAIEYSTHPWGLSADVPGGTELIGASKPMGVFTPRRGGENRLLEYYAKGALDVESAGLSLGMRTEVLAREEGGELVFQVMFDGQPASGAELQVPLPNSTLKTVLTTDRSGLVRIANPGAGSMAVRARVVVDRAGEADDGQTYSTIQHYATLVIASLRGQPAGNGANLNAYERLESVMACQERFPETVTGLGGRLKVTVDGKVYPGEFDYQSGELKLELEDASDRLRGMTRQRVESMIRPRMAASFADGDGRFPLTLQPRDSHPLGRRIDLNDGTGGAIRVSEKEICQIERLVGRERVVVTVHQHEETLDGRFLPIFSTVAYFDAESGALNASESFVDEYKEIDGCWVPSTRRIATSRDGEASVTQVELFNLEILTADH